MSQYDEAIDVLGEHLKFLKRRHAGIRTGFSSPDSAERLAKCADQISAVKFAIEAIERLEGLEY